MITIFENFTIKNHPEIGDYVICKLAYQYFERQDELNLFFENNIGQITDMEEFFNKNDVHDCYQFEVRFEKIPHFFFTNKIFNGSVIFGGGANGIGKRTFEFGKKNNEIVAWSKDRKELEIEIEAKKFGL